MRSIVFIAFAAVLLCGCSSPRRAEKASGIEASLGKEVTLVGVAEPRKGGAALKGDTFYVWLRDVGAWPPEMVMRKVEVVGMLEEDHGLPVFIPEPNDPMMPQGIPVAKGTDLKEASRRLILVNATWKLVE